MDTVWVLLYLAPTLLVMLAVCSWTEVLMIAAINILGGWTIIGWFIALWLAGGMVEDRTKLRALSGSGGFMTWIIVMIVSLLNRRLTVLPPPDRRESPSR